MPGLLRASDLDRSTIDGLLGRARGIADDGPPLDRRPAVIALMFYEDSLRTRFGFAAAAARLGATAVDVGPAKQTRQMAVPETFEDAVRCVAPYCDAICLRHPVAGAAAVAAELAPVPVINCGDGDDEHPTQALIDLLAIERLRGSIDGVRLTVVGDLRHMRTAHSLLGALTAFDEVFVRCVAPPGLGMPARYADPFRAAGGTLETTDDLRTDGVDFVYVAGLPRTPENGVSIELQSRYRIDAAALGQASAHARLLCPLPRIDEIDVAVDGEPAAAYFEQSELGLAMRMATLEHVLGPPAGSRAATV